MTLLQSVPGVHRLLKRIFPRTAPSIPVQSSDQAADPAIAWARDRDRDAAAAVAASPPDFKRYHQSIAARWIELSGKSVLVVGCNRGEDCAHFIDLGAARVVGLDVMDEIGRNYVHPAVSYAHASAERMPFDSRSFDLVFAYATLEHVPDIRAAFHEMARVAAPGGIIYSAAAPLWCCRSGPHWGNAFDHDPWPHLRFGAEGVIAVAEQARAEGKENPCYDTAWLRQCMSDPLMFNRRRAQEYLDACSALEDIEIIANRIDEEQQEGVDSALVGDLIAQGYSALDLFGLTHIFTARKR